MQPSTQVKEIAATLLEDRGFYGARQFVRVALKAGNDPKGFWSRVWDELLSLDQSAD